LSSKESEPEEGVRANSKSTSAEKEHCEAEERE